MWGEFLKYEVRVSKFGLVERTSQDEREAQAYGGAIKAVCSGNVGVWEAVGRDYDVAKVELS